MPDRPNSGFTIIEAVVVIAVMGIIGAVAAPRFLSLSDFDEAQAVRQLLADLRFAQARASGSGCPVQVDFLPDRYTLTQRTNCRSGSFSLDLTDPSTHTTPYSTLLPAGASLASDVDPLVFDALGRATTTGSVVRDVTITLAGRTLAAVGETGFVHEP